MFNISFLNPFFLFGLLAASIPIIIHFLTKKKRKKIEFSSLTYIMEKSINQAKNMKLYRLLLLIIRILIIAFIILSLSQPILKSFLGNEIKKKKNSNYLILIDNTNSMKNIRNGENFLNIAKKISLDMIDKFEKENMEGSVMSFSDFINLTNINFYKNKNEINLLLENIDFTKHFLTLKDISENIKKMPSNISIYIISDFLNEEKNFFNNELQTLKGLDITLIDLSEDIPGNVYIDNVKIHNFKKEINGYKVKLDFEFNSINLKSDKIYTKLFLNDKLMNESEKEINKNGTSNIDYELLLENSGVYNGYLDFDVDNFRADDRYYFSFKINSLTKALIINDDGKINPYLEALLNPENNEIWHTEFIDTQKAEYKDFDNYSLIILSTKNSINSFLIDKMTKYTEKNGKIIILGNKNLDLTSINNFLKTKNAFIINDYKEGFNKNYYTIKDINRKDFFENTTDEELKYIKEIKIYGNYSIKSNENSIIYSELNNGSPFIIFDKNIFFINFSPNIELTDAIYKPGGVILFQKIRNIFLFDNSLIEYKYTGEKIKFNKDNINLIVNPDKSRLNISENSEIELSQEGTYKCYAGDNNLVKIINVNNSTKESKFEKNIEKKQLDLYNIRYKSVKNKIEFFEDFQLWKYLIFLVLLLLMLEGFVRQKIESNS